MRTSRTRESPAGKARPPAKIETDTAAGRTTSKRDSSIGEASSRSMAYPGIQGGVQRRQRSIPIEYRESHRRANEDVHGRDGQPRAVGRGSSRVVLRVRPGVLVAFTSMPQIWAAHVTTRSTSCLSRSRKCQKRNWGSVQPTRVTSCWTTTDFRRWPIRVRWEIQSLAARPASVAAKPQSTRWTLGLLARCFPTFLAHGRNRRTRKRRSRTAMCSRGPFLDECQARAKACWCSEARYFGRPRYSADAQPRRHREPLRYRTHSCQESLAHTASYHCRARSGPRDRGSG